ncbi:hypothetical protein [Streptomyces sp. NPDC001843]|uniref:hypothetical protein n=1 Tax=Streptomyces sp. NPDC001843 TaxID=3364617 RepID=UPI0036976DF8
MNPPARTPKWAVISTEDHAVPTAAQKFEAKRVGAHISYPRSGHDVPSTSPGAVDRAIVAAADSVCGGAPIQRGEHGVPVITGCDAT